MPKPTAAGFGPALCTDSGTTLAPADAALQLLPRIAYQKNVSQLILSSFATIKFVRLSESAVKLQFTGAAIDESSKESK